VLDRRVAADQRLGRPEFEQQVGALGRRRRLGERAAKVGNRALGRPASCCAPGGFAQHGHDPWIRGRGGEQQVRGDPFGLGPSLAEETRRPCMPDVSLVRRECLVDGRADEWVNEPERRLGAQDLVTRERARRLGGSLPVQLRQRGGVVGIGIVAQDRDSLCKPPRFRWETGEANRDGAHAGARSELAQARHASLDRG
jgi:hypothetical protein